MRQEGSQSLPPSKPKGTAGGFPASGQESLGVKSAPPRRLVVVGGGAAGFFAAIRAREQDPELRVDILEASSRPLAKVAISGGGRCNVTHACFDVTRLVGFYPRGYRALRGVFGRFGPQDTVAWFQARGVPLVAEDDGRMFPATHDARTIVDCLVDAAREAGAALHLGQGVRACERGEGGFRVRTRATTWEADYVLLATGSSPQGHACATSLGHALVEPVPSLFTFEVRDARLEGLAGVSLPRVVGRLSTGNGPSVQQEGALLVTHWGLSGPLVLRLSAWGARDLHESGYRADLRLDLAPDMPQERLRETLLRQKASTPRRQVGHEVPLPLPRRLWQALVEAEGILVTATWGQVPQAALNRLAERLKQAIFRVEGKGPFKEEFVTAGGVPLGEVDLRTMQSRVCPGLYLAGEILDVDALTGGFNFQHAWSSGWIAGDAVATRPPVVTPPSACG